MRVITTERPGFGLSTRLPGRGFADHVRDVVEILDHVEVDKVHVYGASGGAPHILALAALQPSRVHAITVLAGSETLTDDEGEQMIAVNARGRQLACNGDVEGLPALLEPIRSAQLNDPLAGFRALMSQAPPEDHHVMSDPQWQESFTRATREALNAGVDGWADETLAIFRDWRDFDPARIETSLTWWHSGADRNAPLSAAARLVATLPDATLRRWPDGGHFAAHRHEPDVLDELLARG